MGMKVAICIATYGEAHKRVAELVRSVNRFTVGVDYVVIVRDDATENKEYVSLNEFHTAEAGAEFVRGEEWGQIWGNYNALGWYAVEKGADLIVFMNDDCFCLTVGSAQLLTSTSGMRN